MCSLSSQFFHLTFLLLVDILQLCMRSLAALANQAMHDLILMKNYNYPSSKKQLTKYAEGVVHDSFFWVLEFFFYLRFCSLKMMYFFNPFIWGLWFTVMGRCNSD